MSGKDEQRVRSLFGEVVNDLKQKLDGVENRMKSLDPKILNLSQKLMNYVKSKCKSQFEWLEKNSTASADGQMELNASVPQAEAEKRLQDLTSCTDKEDFGLRLFFNSINERQAKIQENTSSCLESCYNVSNRKSDNEVKDCFRECFNNTILDMDKIYTSCEDKITEINKRI
jgi:hypothetical protein